MNLRYRNGYDNFITLKNYKGFFYMSYFDNTPHGWKNHKMGGDQFALKFSGFKKNIYNITQEIKNLPSGIQIEKTKWI